MKTLGYSLDFIEKIKKQTLLRAKEWGVAYYAMDTFNYEVYFVTIEDMHNIDNCVYAVNEKGEVIENKLDN